MVGEETKQDRILHVLNRLAFGPRPGDFEHVSAIGPERYVQEQLHPESIAIPADLVERVGEYRTLQMSPIALFVEYQRPLMQERKQAKAEAGGDKADIKDATKDLRIKQRIVMRQAFEARLMRAIDGPRQLQEVMTAFWFNHFNIFAGKGLDLIWTGVVRGDRDSAAYLRQVPRAARRDRASSGDDVLPRQLAEHRPRQSRLEGQVRGYQRKLRARADGTAYAGRQRRLPSGRRNRARAHSDRMGTAEAGRRWRQSNAVARAWRVARWAELFRSCAGGGISAPPRNRSERILFRRIAPRFFEQDFPGSSRSKAAESTKASMRWTSWRAVPPPRII